MKVRFIVGTDEIFAYCEGQPSPGDSVVLPANSFSPPKTEDQEVTISHLRPTWRSDDDGALVPTYDATLKAG